MMYEDRTEAGRVLGERLVERDLRPEVVLAVPPGGVNVARPISERYDADLGLIVTEPIRTPSTGDLPVGAVTDTGATWVDDDRLGALGINEEKLEVEKQRAFREARDKHEVYGELVDEPTPTGVVAVVSEGLVSATPTKAALSALDRVEDCYGVAVAPIGTPDAVAALHPLAEDVVVDETIPDSQLRGEFYETFDRPILPQEADSGPG